ncbi:MAG: hypothetical protein QHH26_02085 [Armatimonadota bacterium]|nr:hypothetical protein [Armatimonadota bacterium]MDH7480751.1 hypothetical protein [Armatimonadota bacterium]
MAEDYKLSRIVRTVSSEIYIIWQGERRIGQVHLHYAHYTIYLTLFFEVDVSLQQEEQLLAEIDDQIVSSYLPSFEREEMLVTIFRGEEISSFSYCPTELDEFDEEEE